MTKPTDRLTTRTRLESVDLKAAWEKHAANFIAFARTGNPTNRLIPRWELYGLPRRQTMIFNVPSRIEDDPRGGERRLFAKVPYVQPGT